LDSERFLLEADQFLLASAHLSDKADGGGAGGEYVSLVVKSDKKAFP
jgi:hypothetical protein